MVVVGERCYSYPIALLTVNWMLCMYPENSGLHRSSETVRKNCPKKFLEIPLVEFWVRPSRPSRESGLLMDLLKRLFHTSKANSQGCCYKLPHTCWLKTTEIGQPGWLSGLAPLSGHDPGDPGSSPMLGSLHGACFSPCLCLCLSAPPPVFLMNK